MNASCNVIQDLLPLYHDGVCSEDSRKLVEEHLKTCEKCGKMNAELEKEEENGHIDERKPLEAINRRVKRGKKKALLKGTALALALILVGFGWSAWRWYENRSAFNQAAANMDADQIHTYAPNGEIVLDKAPGNFERATLYKADGRYQYTLSLSAYPEMGEMKVESIEYAVSAGLYDPELAQSDIHAELYIWYRNGGFEYSVFFPDASWGVAVDGELSVIGLDNMTQEGRERTELMYEEFYEEIAEIVSAAKEVWDLP